MVLNDHWQFHVVFAARTYLEFLDCLSDEEPDLILMDDRILNDMAHRDSSAFLRYVKGIPVAVMGLEIPKQMHRYARVHPSVEFVSKENDRDGLVDKLLELADRHLDTSGMCRL